MNIELEHSNTARVIRYPLAQPSLNIKTSFTHPSGGKIKKIAPGRLAGTTIVITTSAMHLMYTLSPDGKRIYTLKKIVGGTEVTKSAHPARFSPDDKYSRYAPLHFHSFPCPLSWRPHPTPSHFALSFLFFSSTKAHNVLLFHQTKTGGTNFTESSFSSMLNHWPEIFWLEKCDHVLL